jgi:hypothetical protein
MIKVYSLPTLNSLLDELGVEKLEFFNKDNVLGIKFNFAQGTDTPSSTNWSNLMTIQEAIDGSTTEAQLQEKLETIFLQE